MTYWWKELHYDVTGVVVDAVDKDDYYKDDDKSDSGDKYEDEDEKDEDKEENE